MRFFGKYFLHPAAGKYFKAYFSATLIWVGKKKKEVEITHIENSFL